MEVDYKKLSILIKQKRGRDSLRDVEKVTGVSIATLSRIERGSAEDLRLSTFFALCEYLKESPNTFILGDSHPIYQPQEIIFNGVSIRIDIRPA